MDVRIGFADAMLRIFPTALARHLLFRGWIRRETLCGRSSVTFVLRQRACSSATGSNWTRYSLSAAVVSRQVV